MKARSTCLALSMLAPLGAAAQPVTYQLDPAHSFVHFEVMHFGTSTLRGRFGPIEGEVLLDRTAARGEVALRIPTASVNTGVAVLDSRLRQADLLASSEHPEAYFVASNFRFEGAKLAEVRGEFTLRDVSQPLSLRATQFGCYPHPMLQREVCGGDFEGELRRSEFGATFGAPLVGDRVRLLVQVEGIRR
jgi:polyisoprenoid-binding protein YceI